MAKQLFSWVVDHSAALLAVPMAGVAVVSRFGARGRRRLRSGTPTATSKSDGAPGTGIAARSKSFCITHRNRVVSIPAETVALAALASSDAAGVPAWGTAFDARMTPRRPAISHKRCLPDRHAAAAARQPAGSQAECLPGPGRGLRWLHHRHGEHPQPDGPYGQTGAQLCCCACGTTLMPPLAYDGRECRPG